jgi:hypothetical protein
MLATLAGPVGAKSVPLPRALVKLREARRTKASAKEGEGGGGTVDGGVARQDRGERRGLPCTSMSCRN